MIDNSITISNKYSKSQSCKNVVTHSAIESTEKQLYPLLHKIFHSSTLEEKDVVSKPLYYHIYYSTYSFSNYKNIPVLESFVIILIFHLYLVITLNNFFIEI